MTLISLFTRYVIIQTLLFAAAVTQAASSADIVQAAFNNRERPSEDMLDDSRRAPFHRISESLVMSLANGAGLSIERSSDLHANSNDSLEAGVFDPSIQGQMDKFVLLFRKQ